MVLHFYSAFPVHCPLKAHEHARWQLRIRGINILLEGTSTCSWVSWGFEPVTFRLLDVMLCILSYSRP